MPELQSPVRLQRTYDERFYLCVPCVKTFAQTFVTRACAIGPGVWSFVTMYGPDGLIIGVDDMKECILRRCLTFDQLISCRTKEPSTRKRYRMVKHLKGDFRRVRALVGDMHHKVSSWLSTNYTEILLPSFKTAWSHYKLKILLSYQMDCAGGRMIECEELYMTKTCSFSGRLNHNIAREKVFSCSHYTLTLHRDVNAACNICLKNEHLLTRTPGVRVSGDAYSA